jgi:RNA polymerase sigma-70 factor
MNATDVRIAEPTLARLYATSDCRRWAVSADTFAAAVRESVAHRFQIPPSSAELDAYLASLHVADLGLACACRDGYNDAWEHFVRELRPSLYAAARTVAGDEGRELADSLYGDLFGLPGADGTRRSLLAYYHGRSRLLTWLRSVMVQRLVDRRRQTSRLEPLESNDGETTAPMAGRIAPEHDPDREQLARLAQQSLDAAIAELESRDRLRLRLYYGQDLTLARIGRLLGESEATVSRKLERARRAIRERVVRELRNTHGLTEPRVQACFEYAAAAPELHLDRLLAQTEDG